jgi:hypothetical protein
MNITGTIFSAQSAQYDLNKIDQVYVNNLQELLKCLCSIIKQMMQHTNIRLMKT